MSRKYKFYNAEGLHFVSFATVFWIDVFVREAYVNIIIDSLNYCRNNKNMALYCWCIMPSHVHLIFKANDGNPSDILRDFKTHTSKQLVNAISNNPQESRKEWLLWMFTHAGKKNSNVTHNQFWQQNNKPIELWSADVIDQKVNYIHNNPVVAGFVTEAHHWKYSSAIDFSGSKGMLGLDIL